MSNPNKVLFFIAALIAFGLGIFFGQHYFHTHDTSQGEVLWNARLNDSQQQPKAVKELAGQLTLVNFWASWCAPCRKEMPIFESFYRLNKQQGFTIIGVAIDNKETALPMLDSMDITYPILYAERTGMEIMAKSGNEQGFLPYSVLYNAEGVILEAKLGEIDQNLLNKWLNEHL